MLLVSQSAGVKNLEVALAVLDQMDWSVPLSAKKPEMGARDRREIGALLGLENSLGKDFGGVTVCS